MPWKETEPMEERTRFVLLYQDGWGVTELCEYFGVSRKTGYKWLQRYSQGGLGRLQELSRAPHRHPNAVSPELVALIVGLKQERARWGPKKLLDLLQRRRPDVHWPALSTIGEILKRHGLVKPRRRCRKTPLYEHPFVGLDQPNAVWSADLKGWFLTGDGRRCDPLTITDNYSRFLIRCQVVQPPSFTTVQPIFVGAFREYGLPEAIRTDNGSPFASTTLAGLSRLSIWWLKLGILPERIDPGEPQQNGRHERMHRTLKDEAISPPQANWRRQQEAFDRFRQQFNYERPHESLGQRFPSELYCPSPRPYPSILPDMVYPNDMLLRRVRSQGDISWKHRGIHLSRALAGEIVGLRQVADDRWDIYFGPLRLAKLNADRQCLIPLPRTRRKTNLNRRQKEDQNHQKCYPCARINL